jgi:hypothetical protein
MAGGLFGTPLELNPKCLVFSAFVLMVYWMPHFKAYEHRIVMAFVLATAAYVLMAWYDKLYDCTDRFGPTFLGWMSMWFKPQEYRDKFNDLPVKYQKIVRTTDIAVLIVLLGLVASPYLMDSHLVK